MRRSRRTSNNNNIKLKTSSNKLIVHHRRTTTITGSCNETDGSLIVQFPNLGSIKFNVVLNQIVFTNFRCLSVKNKDVLKLRMILAKPKVPKD